MSLVTQTENGRCSCWLDSQQGKKKIANIMKEYETIAYNIILQIFQVSTYAYHWQSKYQ